MTASSKDIQSDRIIRANQFTAAASVPQMRKAMTAGLSRPIKAAT
jgi:hypothetical protein